jgi:hypothetical protein
VHALEADEDVRELLFLAPLVRHGEGRRTQRSRPEGKYEEAETMHKQESIPVPHPSSEVVTTEQSFSRNTAPEATSPGGGRTNSQPRDTTGFEHN